MMSSATHEVSPRHKRKVFVGATAGHLIEWYDYGIYGFLAVTMGQLFFASDNPTVSMLSSFAAFALSFFMRPLGGLIFGPLGDRLGRRTTLTIVVTLMAGSTCLIGFLPTYHTIGIIAPILLVLLRCVQGLSAGGEIGTVTAFVAEYAGPGRRGLSTSWLMVTAVLGLLIGSLAANGFSVVLSDEAMLAWGWRIPFILAGPLGLVAAFIRLKLEDSPEFRNLAAAGRKESTPLRTSLRWYRPLLLVFTIITVHSSIFYLVLTYASTFLTEQLGFDASTKFIFVIVAAAVSAVVMPFGGMISDSIGRKPFLLVTGVAATLAMGWFFLAAPGATPATFIFPLLACALTFGLYASSTYATMTELIPTRIRATGISLAYNLPVAIFGGCAPLIAAWVIAQTGDITAPIWFFVGTGVVSLVALLILRPRDFERASQENELDQTGSTMTDSVEVAESPKGEATLA